MIHKTTNAKKLKDLNANGVGTRELARLFGKSREAIKRILANPDNFIVDYYTVEAEDDKS